MATPTHFTMSLLPALCRATAAALLITAATTAPAADDDEPLRRLAACGESWLDWKDDPATAQRFAAWFRERFIGEARSPAWRPRRAQTVFGLPVVQAYPQSVGMARGFSIEVRAGHEAVRRAMEAAIGRPMRCERGDGTLDCELKLAERRIALVMSANGGRGEQSLIGCYYDYQP